jgi:hypothetical protein
VDGLIAKALEGHTSALADYESEKVVFDAHKDAIKERIKGAAKKPSKGDPASIAKKLRTHGEQAPDARHCGATRPTPARWRNYRIRNHEIAGTEKTHSICYD